MNPWSIGLQQVELLSLAGSKEGRLFSQASVRWMQVHSTVNVGSKSWDIAGVPLIGGVSVWYGVCLIQLVSLCFQLPLFWAIISVIHLPFFSIQPCKWSPHTRQMCCRPEFPTNYRLEIRTIRVIRASSVSDMSTFTLWLNGQTWVEIFVCMNVRLM